MSKNKTIQSLGLEINYAELEPLTLLQQWYNVLPLVHDEFTLVSRGSWSRPEIQNIRPKNGEK